MSFYIYFILILTNIIYTESTCVERVNYCSKCNPVTKLCIKCEKDIFSPDNNGGCQYSKKCELGRNHCLECLDDGNICNICDEGYFPDNNGGCSITDNCEISYRGQCLECKKDYILIGIRSVFETLNDYLKICKHKNSDEFLNCRSISYDRGYCLSCEDGYFLTSDRKCTKVQNCVKAYFGVCKSCNNGYYLDKKQEKCILAQNSFKNCDISNDGKKCDKCNEDFYFDDEGKCVYSNYCSKGDNYRCEKCVDGYYLATNGGVCTTEKYCSSGRRDIGICSQCETNYCIDYKDGKCKSNQENNDLKYCSVADTKCKICIYGKYLGQDQKCTNTTNCAKSENGECIKCADYYYLGLDKKCSYIEHCIYSDENFNCLECEENFYYNIEERKCKIAEGIFQNCKISNDGGKYCEKCKTGFYINQNDYLCYSNKEKNDFYKCSISNGDFCTKCEENYYLGYTDHKCSKAENCDIIENENRCFLCQDTYCLDAKTGLCEDNDIINDIEKIFYFRCNKTNDEATECKYCLEGYELRDGLCFDEQHCIQRNNDGTCKKCKKFEDEYFEQCLSDVFGCVEGYYDENCLKCDDLSNVGYCTECLEGFELDKYNNCNEIDEKE